MSSGAIRAAGAFVDLSLQDRLRAGLNRAMGSLRRYASNVTRIGRQLTAVSIAPAVGVGFALKGFADLEDQLLQLRALARAGGTPFNDLADQVKELGRTTSFTARQVAEGATSLARGGFDTSEISSALSSTLNLSRATGTELGQAADIMINVMRSFGLGANEAGRAADVLVATASGSAQTLEDLFESLKLLGPFATETGTSLEEMAASLGILANNGIKGSLAGNAVVRAYRNLANSKIGDKIAAITGKSVVDAEGNVRPLIDVLEELDAALAGGGSAERLSAFEQIFGRGQIAATILSKAAGQMRSFTEDLENVGGKASKVGKDMDSGLGGSLRRLSSAWEGFTNKLGETLSGPLTKFLEWATEATGRITEFVAANRTVVLTIAGITAGAIALGPALVGIGVAFSGIVGVSALVGSALVGTTVLLAKVTSAAVASALSVGRLAAALVRLGPAGAVAAGTLVTSFAAGVAAMGPAIAGGLRDGFNTGVRAAKSSISGLVDSISRDFTSLKIAITSGDLEGAFDVITAHINTAWVKLMAGLEESWSQFIWTVTASSSAFAAAAGRTFGALKGTATSREDEFAAINDAYKQDFEDRKRRQQKIADAEAAAQKAADALRDKQLKSGAEKAAALVEGAKRGGAELAESMQRVGAQVKASLLDSIINGKPVKEPPGAAGRALKRAERVEEAVQDAVQRSQVATGAAAIRQLTRGADRKPELDALKDIHKTLGEHTDLLEDIADGGLAFS